VSRATREGAVRGAGTPVFTKQQDVQLAPDLRTVRLPPVVDTQRVEWPVNPFGALPSGESGAGSVVEISVVDAASGVSVPLQSVTGSAMPVYFRIPLGGHGTFVLVAGL
jgi:hypothetical protein